MTKKSRFSNVAGNMVSDLVQETEQVQTGETKFITREEVRNLKSLFHDLQDKHFRINKSDVEYLELQQSVLEVGVIDAFQVVIRNGEMFQITGHRKREIILDNPLSEKTALVQVNVRNISDDEAKLIFFHSNIKGGRKFTDLQIADMILEMEKSYEALNFKGDKVKAIASELDMSKKSVERMKHLGNLIEPLRNLFEEKAKEKGIKGKLQQIGMLDQEVQQALYDVLGSSLADMKLEEIEELKTSMADENSNLKTEIDKMSDEIKDKETKLKEANQDIEDLVKQIEELNNQLKESTAENESEAIETEIAQLTQSLANARKDMETLKEQEEAKSKAKIKEIMDQNSRETKVLQDKIKELQRIVDSSNSSTIDPYILQIKTVSKMAEQLYEMIESAIDLDREDISLEETEAIHELTARLSSLQNLQLMLHKIA